MSRRSTAVLIVLVGWGYVVGMMALAEASGPGGSVLGALVTALLYGALPMSVIWYVGSTRARRARRAASDLDPGGRGETPGDPVAPEREEP